MEWNVSSIAVPGTAASASLLAECEPGDERPVSGFSELGQAGWLSPAMPEPHLLLQVEKLTKVYMVGGRELRLFDGLDVGVRPGELVAIVGPSGAGKSTLLHMLGALDTPTSGQVYCASTCISTLTRKQAARFRNREVGFVWQCHYLLPEFSAAENVAMPLLAGGAKQAEALDSARVWLRRVGLSERADHRAGQLSGGEQQRVAIARALVTEPKLLLADEPTGDLDGESADSVFSLIESLHRSHQLTTVLVTHNMALARRASRVLRLGGGRLEEVAANAI
jgi:lipoprotein-releasing system ATP-binding protein